MTFETYEESQEQGLPVSLFHIQYGDQPANYWAYCDSDQAVTFNSVTYTPIAIGRENIENSGGLDNKTLTVDITPNSEIAEFYKTNRPTNVVILTIYQGHPNDPDNDFKVVWSGRITGVQRKTRFAQISAEPIVTSMRRPGLRRYYQYGCPWVLYSPNCGASSAAGKRTALCTAVGNNLFEFADGWEGGTTKTKFRSGYVEWIDPVTGATQIMTILKVQVDVPTSGTDRIIVNGRTSAAIIGTSVDIYLGCNHQTSDCENLHNNLVNYGGQKWIPSENPVGFTNRFY